MSYKLKRLIPVLGMGLVMSYAVYNMVSIY